MQDIRTSLFGYLPSAVISALQASSHPWERSVQELRLRRNAPPVLSCGDSDYMLPVTVTAAQLQDCFWRLCSQAIHAHEAELAQGFITTPEGIRVGVAGTAVVQKGRVTSYRDITSLCIRIPRIVKGCSAALLPYVLSENGINGLLLCGAPASGKTTVLRDLAASLSETCRVVLVDERCELASTDMHQCDVLKECPKAVGILQAVRTLAPDVIVADELGEEAEWESVEQSAYCGVPLIASAHIGDPKQVAYRSGLLRLLSGNGFSLVAFLPPRQRPFSQTRIWKARDLLEGYWDRADCVCLRSGGDHLGDTSAR